MKTTNLYDCQTTGVPTNGYSWGRNLHSFALAPLLLFLLLLCPRTGVADNGVTADGFSWSSSGGQISITGYGGLGTAITIPSTIPGVFGSVTSIADYAFWGRTSLTSVTIPSGVTSIGNVAFYNCSGLTSVTIPSSVTRIADNAFIHCWDLRSVFFLGNAPSMGDSVFYDCAGSFIAYFATGAIGFTTPTWDGYSCMGLTTDGFAWTSSGNQISITGYRGAGGAITIPSAITGISGTVTSIGSSAFLYCTSATSVQIPTSITTIGAFAFDGCTGLASVTIPSSVTTIGTEAFWGCTALTSVTIPSGVTSIADFTFWGCTALTSVTIPSSVTSIGTDAFMFCGLTSVTIPSSVTSIGSEAFYSCTALISVTVPLSVSTILSNAFQNCTSLRSALFLGNAPTMGSGVFGGCASGFVIYYNGGATGFTTPTWYGYPCSPLVSTGQASGVGLYGATLSGTVNPNGLATTCFFNYGTSGTYGLTTGTQNAGNGTSASGFTAQITGLTPGTLYHFQIVTVNSSGTSSGLDQTFTTANPPPSVITGPATGVTYQAATLSGTVTPNGLATTCYFNYGTSATYGMVSGSQSAGAGGAPTPVGIPIATLLPATGYHFQIVAVNSSGTSVGLDQTFTTANTPPPAVITGVATGVTYQAATLTGTVNPNGLATAYYFNYGTSGSYGMVSGTFSAGAGLSGTATAAPIAALSSTTLYHYQIVAVNSSGTSVGLDQTFTTANPPSSGTTATGFHWSASAGQITITGYSGVGGTVTIPSAIPGIPGTVTAIGAYAFFNCTGLTSLIIPSSVTSFADWAFYACTGLTSVTIPSSITSFGMDVFYGCTGLTSVTISPGVTHLGDLAFNDCTGLTSVTIPSSVTSFGYEVFWSCSGLKSALFLGNAPTMGSGVFGGCARGFAIYYNGGAAGFTTPTWYGYPCSPLMSTGQASGVSFYGATLSGTINPHMLSGSAYFAFGPTNAYGSTSGTFPIGPSSQDVPVSFEYTVTGLQPATLFHYCLFGWSASGTNNGGDLWFVTRGGAPTATALSTGSIAARSMTVSATIDPNGFDTLAHFEYVPSIGSSSTTANVTMSASRSATPVSANLRALHPHTTYRVRAVATNSKGTSVSSPDKIVRTLPRTDINGDGYADLIATNTTSHACTMLLARNGVKVGSITGPVIPAGYASGGMADFNGDGKVDWVLYDTKTLRVWIWTMNNGTVLRKVAGPVLPSGYAVAGAADMKGDGTPDLILWQSSTRRVAFLQMQGTAGVGSPVVFTSLPSGFKIVAVEDLNGDGKPDLLIWSPSTRSTKAVLLNPVLPASPYATLWGPAIPAGWQLAGADAFTLADSANWLLYNPTTRCTTVWTMKGVSCVSKKAGLTLPPGTTLLQSN